MLTVDGRRADDGRFDGLAGLGTSVEHHLVDVAVEGVVGETGELFDLVEVVVYFVRSLSIPISIGIDVGQDASAAGVEPVPGMIFRVAARQALGDGFGGTFVV